MSNKPGYCPYCGAELTVREIESTTRILIWNACPTARCPASAVNFKTDPKGFIIEPAHIAGAIYSPLGFHLYSRP